MHYAVLALSFIESSYSTLFNYNLIFLNLTLAVTLLKHTKEASKFKSFVSENGLLSS